MRFRRRFATGGRFRERLDAAGRTLREALVALWTSVSGRMGRPRRRFGRAAPDAVAAGAPGTAGAPARAWSLRDRRVLVAAGVFGGTFAAGYLVAAIALFPAPFLAGRTSIPNVVGREQDQARDALVAAGFAVGTVERITHPSVPAGAVVWQDPPADVVAPEATEVSLLISSGPQRVPVPDVAGYDAAHARVLLEGAGLRIGSTESIQAPTPRDVAVNTRPPAGTPLNPGSDVVLVVSVGAATIRVPALTGLTVEEARLALETAGLALGTAFAQTSLTVAPGEIFYQDPAAGTLSAPGTVVNVRYARSP